MKHFKITLSKKVKVPKHRVWFLTVTSQIKGMEEIKLNEMSDSGLDLESRWKKKVKMGQKLDMEYIFW